ncbi:uncharacterized protein K489DRAFT_229180 [Dissoconium aciculare CBS 342.82]|uniref:Uncharacterized protein n=1 Tax=Dissoconium aciculare CBS 342.82 TaxID=1314786 RepID=A0A6J3M4Y8_9PEZI|nr:uncharacterized protein K489DRAFT_229180 [Dissoconium aciculare CBS 342.82]KAF1821952.1 hypothetical protein K489DRAFT_229180 [Dissoconium aciculare CBS 342.82]
MRPSVWSLIPRCMCMCVCVCHHHHHTQSSYQTSTCTDWINLGPLSTVAVTGCLRSSSSLSLSRSSCNDISLQKSINRLMRDGLRPAT